jgi:hypothetical protein
VPDELSDVIDWMLENKPSRPPASAEEVRQRSAALLSRAQQYGVGRRSFGRWHGARGRRKLLAGLTMIAAASAAAARHLENTPLARRACDKIVANHDERRPCGRR